MQSRDVNNNISTLITADVSHVDQHMVPKFAFLVLEIGLRSPQFENFLRNWYISLNHMAFFSGKGHILFGG